MTTQLLSPPRPSRHIDALLALDPGTLGGPSDGAHWCSTLAIHVPGPEWPPGEWD
jgi:hypothetical protein